MAKYRPLELIEAFIKFDTRPSKEVLYDNFIVYYEITRALFIICLWLNSQYWVSDRAMHMINIVWFDLRDAMAFMSGGGLINHTSVSSL